MNASSISRLPLIRWILLIFVLIALFYGRYRLLDVPMERDEGEYAYAGQLILKGHPPYEKAYNMKFPGIYYFYALVLKVFGETLRGVHWGLLWVNAFSLLFFYLAFRKVSKPRTALYSTLFYSLLTMGQWVHGMFFNSEHALVLWMLLGLYFLFSSQGRFLWIFSSALFLALAFLTKQHGIAFVGFGVFYLMWQEEWPWNWKNLGKKMGIFLFGAAVPLTLLSLYFLYKGNFDAFKFWTLDYAREYVSIISFKTGLNNFLLQMRRIVPHYSILWFFSFLGGLFCLVPWKKKKSLALLFFLCSFIAICPGFFFRAHYFLLLLPAIAFLGGIGVDWTEEWIENKFNMKGLGIVILFLIIGQVFWKEGPLWYKATPAQVSRSTFGMNPFPESVKLAELIKKHTKEEDNILVFGSEPQIYFYADRPSATGYIYTYALMEPQKYALKMQKEMIEEIESNKPRYIINVAVRTSWLVRKSSEKHIFKWIKPYLKQHYYPVAVVDMISPENCRFISGKETLRYRPQSRNYLYLFQRKEA